MYHEMRWTLEKIQKRLELIQPYVYRRQETLPPFRYLRLEGPSTPAPVGVDLDDSAWGEIPPNTYWGIWMTDFALRTTFTVPTGWEKDRPVALYLPLGESGDFSHPEALAYIDGQPWAACDRHHQEMLIKPAWMDGNPHTLALHGWTGLGGAERGDFFTKLFMRPCSLVQVDPPLRELISLTRVTVDTTRLLKADDPVRSGLLNALNAAYIQLETREPGSDTFYASVPAALEVLKEGISSAGSALDVSVHASGHAHIDVAWLWTLDQTRQKAARTFTNVLRYMEQFPGYHYSQSQPQLYDFIRQDRPELFKAIQAQVKDGRWEPMGGMWVEADCNLSGAESLARQFLLGRSFYREHFGADAESPVLWLPDVFGYAWALPQLIQQAGLKYFMTIKIGWSQYNRLPYDTFLWQGLDGTRILTHFSTVTEIGSPYASTYNSMANPAETLGAWQNFQQKELHRDLLMSYGFGDGGGGPTREMLENIAVMSDFPGLPRVQNSSVRRFFEKLEPLVDSPMMPVWNGELYLEYHRGTYTTQAHNKRANRKSEFLLHDAEFLATAASLLDPEYEYPRQAFTEAWQTVCLNQFHDIIPGSSIGPVYEESQAQYAQLAENVIALRDQALGSLAGKLGGQLLLVNPTNFISASAVFLPGGLPKGLAPRQGSKTLAVQEVEGGCLVAGAIMPPYSVTAFDLQPELKVKVKEEIVKDKAPQDESFHVLENSQLYVEFNSWGDLVRVYDKQAEREVLARGAIANQFQAFEDRPLSFDAWDVDIYYDDKIYLAEPASSIRMIEDGPIRQTLEIQRRILTSPYTQRISLSSAGLKFDTRIEWNERATLLKVAFPVDILSPVATYEIQWGNVQRPTHRNTSWDWARFESCAHKWVDLSQGDYGVSLLNDCKYGHDIHDNVLRLTLLRGPGIPDPAADYGEHHFTYSLFMHAGGWGERTQAAAYELNDPPIAYLVPGKPNEKGLVLDWPSFVSALPANVIIETVKKAEDGEGIILRLYESQRKQCQVQLHFPFKVTGAWLTDLLEEKKDRLEWLDRTVTLELKPYQIATLRVQFQ
jgi:alpha-mannosidase